MTPLGALAARFRLALVCAALALGGPALPAEAVAAAPPAVAAVLVAGPRVAAPRARRARPADAPAIAGARRTDGTAHAAPPAAPSSRAPRAYLLHRALLR